MNAADSPYALVAWIVGGALAGAGFFCAWLAAHTWLETCKKVRSEARHLPVVPPSGEGRPGRPPDGNTALLRENALTAASGIHSVPPRGGEQRTGASETNSATEATVPGAAVNAFRIDPWFLIGLGMRSRLK